MFQLSNAGDVLKEYRVKVTEMMKVDLRSADETPRQHQLYSKCSCPARERAHQEEETVGNLYCAVRSIMLRSLARGNFDGDPLALRQVSIVHCKVRPYSS